MTGTTRIAGWRCRPTGVAVSWPGASMAPRAPADFPAGKSEERSGSFCSVAWSAAGLP